MAAKQKPRGKPFPTTLTDAIEKKICSSLKQGNYLETAAALAGVSNAAVRKWLRSGAKALTADWKGLGAQQRREAGFAINAARAQAEAEKLLLDPINKAARGHVAEETTTTTEDRIVDGKTVTLTKTATKRWHEYDWRAAAWRLEKMHRDRYGGDKAAAAALSKEEMGSLSRAERLELAKEALELLGLAPLELMEMANDEQETTPTPKRAKNGNGAKPPTLPN
jgi:hypothetical protein